MKKIILLSGFLSMASLLVSCTTDDFDVDNKITNEELIQINTNSIQENNYNVYSKDADTIVVTTEDIIGIPIVKPKKG